MNELLQKLLDAAMQAILETEDVWAHKVRFSVFAPSKPNQAESLLPVIQPDLVFTSL